MELLGRKDKGRIERFWDVVKENRQLVVVTEEDVEKKVR